MPREFKFAPFWATKAQLWAPLALGSRLTDRGGGSLRVFARLKPGVTLEQAQAEMAGITGRLEREFPAPTRTCRFYRCARKYVGNIPSRASRVVRSRGLCAADCLRQRQPHAAGARGRPAREEIALRTALGAGRWDVFRQLLTESMALALVGGAAGLLLAVWGVRVLLAISPDMPRVETVGVEHTRAAVRTRYFFTHRGVVRDGSGLESDCGQPQ